MQDPSGVGTAGAAGDLSGRAAGDDAAAAFAALGPQIDDVVGLGDHVEVVLDHHHGVAGAGEPVQDLDEPGTSAMCRPMVGSSST